MEELYVLIKSKMQGIVNTFVGHYPTDLKDEAGKPLPKVYPYAEINFPNITPNNSFSDKYSLVIDIWDNKDTDISRIEGIVDGINSELNGFRYIDSSMQVSVYKNTPSPYRLILSDSTQYVQRRQLKYLLTVYKI